MANDDTLDILRYIARGETTSQMREIKEGFTTNKKNHRIIREKEKTMSNFDYYNFDNDHLSRYLRSIGLSDGGICVEGNCKEEERPSGITAVRKYRKELTSKVKSQKTGIHKMLKKRKNDDATCNDYYIPYLKGCEAALKWVLETLKE